MSAPDAPTPHLDWLFALQRFGVRPGLEAMRALLTDLGAPQAAMRCVLVAGTNGKGSVASTLSACLTAAGVRTGLYTSPHLQQVGERVLVAGAPLTATGLDAVVGRVRPAAERHGNTFFEVMTAAALLAFEAGGVETAVLEVGLGGRLDATNVVEPALAVITSVALDHMAVLGDTLAQIAREKAGVMRPGVPVVSGVTDLEPAAVVAAHAAELGAPLTTYGADFWGEDARLTWEGSEFTWRHPGAGCDGSRVRSPLVGAHQVANATLALEAALLLGVPLGAALRGAAAATWPGRLESFTLEGRRVVLDGAHNPAAAKALAAAVRQLGGGAAALVFGASADKDVAAVLAELAPLAPAVILTSASHSPRAMPPAELLTLLPRAQEAPDPAAALRAALDVAAPGETVLVAGSLFLVGEVRDLLSGAVAEDRDRWQ